MNYISIKKSYSLIFLLISLIFMDDYNPLAVQTYKLDNINQIYLNRLCLPSSSQLTKKKQDFICKKLENFL